MFRKQLKKVTASILVGLFLGAIYISLKTNPQDVKADTTAIYDYSSIDDSEFTSNHKISSNLLYRDKFSDQSFTLSASSFIYNNPNISWLGGNKYTTLTGTASGQFLHGTPNIQTLATTSNLDNTKYLYGIRINQDIDLTNYHEITITFGWSSGGSQENFTGFLLKTTSGDSESWSVMGSTKVSLNLNISGTLSFTDTNDNILNGTSARFAFVMGSTKAVAALKNFTFKVEGSLKTTLDSLSNLNLNHIGPFVVGESIYHSDILFSADYSFRNGGNTVELTGASNGAIISSVGNLIDYSDPFSYSSAGEFNIKITYQDPSGFGTKYSTLPIQIVASEKILTGIFAVDNKSHNYYQYEFFTPEVNIYPLYDNEIEPNMTVLPIQQSFYTCSVDYSQPIKDQFNAEWYFEYQEGEFFTSNTISYTYADRNFINMTLSNYKQSFYVDEVFSLGDLVLSSNWTDGPNTVIPFSPVKKDGYYTTSIPLGTTLDNKGTFQNTISYFSSSNVINESYYYSVDYEMISIFQYHFATNIPVFGATSSVQSGLISQTESLVNVVQGGTNVNHTLSTFASKLNGGETSYYLAGNNLVLGSSGKGPNTVLISTPEVANSTINGISYMAISILRIDLTTTSVGSVTASVAGVVPIRYQIDGSDQVTASSAPTKTDGNPHIYLFYLPYVTIGKVNFSITNNANPTPIGISYFAYAGFDFSPEDQAEAFGQMLNASNSCLSSTYTNKLPTYNYLVTTGADNYLDEFIMSNHNGMNASELWSLICQRFSVPNGSQKQEQQSFPAIFGFSVIAMSLGAILFGGLIYRKNKQFF